MSLKTNSLKRELISESNPSKIEIYKNFHKTNLNGYAKGETFLGVTVPKIRKIAKKYLDIPYEDILNLLSSNVHEEKYIASEILAEKYNISDNKKEIFDFYINNAGKFTGWDLVDTTASQIAGNFLYHFGKDYPAYKILLSKLSKSSNLWEKRISIVATHYFIKNNDFNIALEISRNLLKDKHDLIHKAMGWTLREVGKKDEKALEKFLKENYNNLPRTTLRYSIERFPLEKRKYYLNLKNENKL